METCRTARITHDGEVVCTERTMPELHDGEVLVKVRCSLISPGTETALIRERRARPAAPGDDTGFGYSTAGEIVAIKGDPRGLKVGMRVAGMGGGADHSEWNRIPVNLAVPIPDGVSFEEAAFASLAATSLHAVRRTEVGLGEYGMVLGLGIVGNLAAQLYTLSGARTLAWEPSAGRREIAAACGIKSIGSSGDEAAKASREFAAPYGMDFALMAFGGDGEAAFAALSQAMKRSADGHLIGRVVVVGGCTFPFSGGAATGNLDVRCSARTGAGYHDVRWEHGDDYPEGFVQFTSQRNARELLRLIAEKRLLVKPLITHRMKLENVSDAAELLLTRPDRALGIILEM